MIQKIQVQDLNELYTITNLDEGTVAYVIDTKNVCVWDGKQWSPISIENKGIEMNLYELNKNLISQSEPMSPNELNEKKELVYTYYNQNMSNFNMLLCKDYNYYTLFALNPSAEFNSYTALDFTEHLYEILTELGTVYNIELLLDGVMEIWLKPKEELEVYAFYLFPYDKGVVFYG